MAVQVTMQYLKRDKLYEVEKPYNVEFEPDNSAVQRTNLIPCEQELQVQSIQPSHNFELEINGFCVIDEELALDAEKALRDLESVEGPFLEQIKNLLLREFPQYQRVEPLELQIRSRDKNFPSPQKILVDYEQPVRLAHSDYTSRGALLQLKTLFPGQENYFENREFDMINVWRPLFGPNDDWPLALCDFTSIDVERDIKAGDTIHIDGVCENQLLHANKDHRWYYIENQQTNQLFIFRNTDSTGCRAKAFHAAFDNPNRRGPARVSCEARLVAFRRT